MARKIFRGLISNISGLRGFYHWLRLYVRCFFYPSSSGPWPFISFRLHLLLARIWIMFVKSDQHFGGQVFYQSCEPIGLIGVRPTAERAKIYGVDQYLTSNSTVLDIGANTGFFSIHIADKVGHIDAIEIDQTLSLIGKTVAKWLDKNNIVYHNCNFNLYQSEKPYDVIFAFAVHKWASNSIDDFSKKLLTFCKSGSIIFFESNNIVKDPMFSNDLKKLCQYGFDVVKIVDTHYECSRKMAILKKL